MNRIYQLKIELVNSEPLIWRRITVPDDTPFDQLHDIIQITMGWENTHLYEFKVKDITVRDFDADIDTGDNPDDEDAMDTYLDELLTKEDTQFTYTYDFGDQWEHRITLEEILPPSAAPGEPQCIGAEGSCPPEDCGGIARYQDIVKILADENHPEHDDLKEAYMDALDDAALVDVNDINEALAEYAEAWDEIYDDAEQLIKDLEDDEEDEDEDDEVTPDKMPK